MRFANPVFLALAALTPVAAFFWAYLAAKREKALSRITLKVPRAGASGMMLPVMSLGLALALVAAARPQWGRDTEKIVSRSRNVVVALDVSRSMRARDVRPDRLERAIADILDLIDSLGEDRCALVAFRKSAVTLSPLTTDRALLKSRLASIDEDSAPAGETNLGSGIREALQVLDPAADDHNAIILISDGGDLQGEAVACARLAKKRGVPVFTVGIGNPDQGATIPSRDGKDMVKFNGEVVKVRLEESALKEIAKESGGAYVPLKTYGAADKTLGAIYRKFLRETAAKEQNEEETHLGERYQLSLAPLI